MAKAKTKEKKVKNTIVESTGELKTSQLLKKKFGDDLIVTGDKIVEKEIELIPFSPSLDRALNGGLKTGQIVVIAGEPKHGKSFSALHFCANAQRAGKKIIFISAEGRLEKRDICSINGLNVEEIEVIGSFKGKSLSAEEYCYIIQQYLINETDCVVVLDSVSILAQESEMLNDISQQSMGGNSRLLGRLIRTVSGVIPINNHTFIMIAQRYANIGNTQGKKTVIKIPNSVRYALSTLIEFEWIEKVFLGDKEDANQIGIKAHIHVHCSPTGPPNTKAITHLRFDYGIDDIQENIDVGIDLAVIEKSGSWFSFGEKKMQGVNSLRQYFVDNPDEYQSLQDQIKDMSGE